MILVSQTESTSHLIPFVRKINTKRKMAVCLSYFLVNFVTSYDFIFTDKDSLSRLLNNSRFGGLLDQINIEERQEILSSQKFLPTNVGEFKSNTVGCLKIKG